jgi:hypothetical protein
MEAAHLKTQRKLISGHRGSQCAKNNHAAARKILREGLREQIIPQSGSLCICTPPIRAAATGRLAQLLFCFDPEASQNP